MSDPDVLLGVQRCGCITLVETETDAPDRTTRAALARIVSQGGEVRRMSLASARATGCFLPSECPHNPKGWEREAPKEPDPIRFERPLGRRGVWIVYCRVSAWKTTGGFRGGEVAERNGKWWATGGWMDAAGVSAHDGRSPSGPAPVYGPFQTRRAAAEHLLPLATRAAERFHARPAGADGRP